MKAPSEYRKGSKKYWKAVAKQQSRIADDLMVQLQQRAGELQEIDLALRNAEFPGPTLPDWANQLATFFLELAARRGVKPRPFPGATPFLPLHDTSGPRNSTRAHPSPYSSGEAPDNGEHELLTTDDVAARS